VTCYRVDADVLQGSPDFSDCRVAKVVRRQGADRTFYVECDSVAALALSDQPGVVSVEETRDADCSPDS
jgi:hypothetical protein